MDHIIIVAAAKERVALWEAKPKSEDRDYMLSLAKGDLEVAEYMQEHDMDEWASLGY